MAQKKFVGQQSLEKVFSLIKSWVTGELAKKADTTALTAHTGNTDIHVTTADKGRWDGKQDKLTAGANISIEDGTISASGVLTEVSWGGITGTLASQTDLKAALDAKAAATDLTAHTGNADIHVTKAQKTAWDAKLDTEDIANLATKAEVAAKANSADVYTKTQIDDFDYQNASEVSSAITAGIAGKQDKLIAGTAIEIAADGKTVNVKVADLDIPANVSDLTNDSGYQTASDVNGLIATGIAGKADTSALTAHTGNSEIHVTATDKQKWNAKLDATAIADMATKTELAAKADAANVYTKAQIDEKGFQNASQVESAITAKGYQNQAQVSQAITAAVADITSFEFQVVAALPSTGEKGIIYLVSHTHGDGDTYDEYIWVNEAFEKIGNTDIDLSGYVLSTDLVEITGEEVQQLWDDTLGA